MERQKIIDYVTEMRTRDHAILLYTNREDKHYILFTYIKAGLENGEAAAYVTSEETPKQIRNAMKEYGISVRRYEKSGALRIIDYKKWYIIGGGFDPAVTIDLWKKLAAETESRGFKGLRVTGEMSCFFDYDMIVELIEYEAALKKPLAIPMTAICAYDQALFNRHASQMDTTRALLSLIQEHNAAIFVEPVEGVVRTI